MQGGAPTMAVQSLKASGERLRWRRTFNVIAVIYLTLLIGPWQFSMPKPGLDWSYHAVIAHALVSGWEWGRDVILTFGPLGILYSRLFVEGTLLTTVVFWILVALVLAINFLDLAKSVPLSWACILFIGFALPFTYERVEPVFFVIPLLAAIGTFRSPRPVATWKILFLVLLAGPAALIKLSFGILSLAIFLVLDTDRALRKTLPLYTPIFLVSVLAGYLYAGQNPLYFPEFLSRSVGAVSGYSEAMQLWGSSLELGFFLLAGAAVAALFWHFELRRADTRRPLVRTALFAACLGLFLFMIFKAGFVRQDLHTITSWDALSAGVAAYIASVWHRIDSHRTVACSIGVMVFAGIYSMLVQASWGQLDLWNKVVGVPVQQLASAAIFVADPDAWLLHNRRSREATLAAIRKGTPLSHLDDFVDSIPPIQSPVLAHGLDYRPRPNVLEHMGYTAALVEANLEFIRSERAPRYIIHGTGSIDGRYPSLADGPMWPELLRFYEPLRLEGNFLLLRRRTVALNDILSEPMQAAATLGRGVAIPVSGPVFVSIAVRQTFFGRIAQLLFKPGEIWLTVKLADDSTRSYRLIPGIARHGFVLSPLIENNSALAALSAGRAELLNRLNVVAFQIDADPLAKLAYESTFEVQVRALQTQKLRALSPDSEINSHLN